MKLVRFALPAVALALTATAGSAQTGDQDVTFEVQAINEIAFSGSPSLTINSATAGDAPTSVTAPATYAITTNETNRKVTAEIDAAMPAGVTLSVELAAPTGGSSSGSVDLGTSAQDVVTGVSTLNESGLGVTYTLQATAAAGVVASQVRTVTYTITAGP